MTIRPTARAPVGLAPASFSRKVAGICSHLIIAWITIADNSKLIDFSKLGGGAGGMPDMGDMADMEDDADDDEEAGEDEEMPGLEDDEAAGKGKGKEKEGGAKIEEVS